LRLSGAIYQKKERMTDSEFTASLTAYFAQFSEGQETTVPLFKKDDGSIDREKTLPCAVTLIFPR
jgi:hypothetical protein